MLKIWLSIQDSNISADQCTVHRDQAKCRRPVPGNKFEALSLGEGGLSLD